MRVKNFYVGSEVTTLITIFSFVTIILISFAGYLTGSSLGLHIFYLIPITLSSWILGKFYGWVISTFSSVCWLLSEVLLHKYKIFSLTSFLLFLLLTILSFIYPSRIAKNVEHRKKTCTL